MTFDIAVVMDPIGSINIKKDSTFAMLLEAQRRGHRLHYFEQGQLYLDGASPRARVAALAVRDDPDGWYELGPTGARPLTDFDVVLARKDPPFENQYLYDTLVLERAAAAGVLVVNEP